MKIVIIGAGIGGLTTALALKSQGHDVTVYEGAPQIKPVGAGIIMANNAMQIFDKLGVRRKVEAAGRKISSIKITDEKLRTLSDGDLSKFENQYGVYNVAIHRGELLKILVDGIGMENIQLSKRLIRVETGSPHRLFFDDGSQVNCDVLIGADGIKSVVRNQVFGSGVIRDTKQRCWRGVSEFDSTEKYNQEAFEAWGRGKRFGFVKISEKKVYWYAVSDNSLIGNGRDIGDLFYEFHPDVLQIISETPKQQIIFSDIIDLKPLHGWQKGKVCLIGDAAHATTPNIGQGACQAVEDAYTISKLLGEMGNIEDVFFKYEKIRKEKAHFIANTSWIIGKVAHFRNPIAVWFRNQLLRITPKSTNEKQLEKIFNIS